MLAPSLTLIHGSFPRTTLCHPPHRGGIDGYLLAKGVCIRKVLDSPPPELILPVKAKSREEPSGASALPKRSRMLESRMADPARLSRTFLLMVSPSMEHRVEKVPVMATCGSGWALFFQPSISKYCMIFPLKHTLVVVLLHLPKSGRGGLLSAHNPKKKS